MGGRGEELLKINPTPTSNSGNKISKIMVKRERTGICRRNGQTGL
jgi:hypothetical protein